jgi:hypothetical protein
VLLVSESAVDLGLSSGGRAVARRRSNFNTSF